MSNLQIVAKALSNVEGGMTRKDFIAMCVGTYGMKENTAGMYYYKLTKGKVKPAAQTKQVEIKVEAPTEKKVSAKKVVELTDEEIQAIRKKYAPTIIDESVVPDFLRRNRGKI